MKLAATYAFKAPGEKVFAALVDPAILQKCIDGCEKMEKTGEESYDAHLKIGVAGIKGSYVGKVRIEEKETTGVVHASGRREGQSRMGER
jgi:carbon monoxide dehydrogenase subunit G